MCSRYNFFLVLGLFVLFRFDLGAFDHFRLEVVAVFVAVFVAEGHFVCPLVARRSSRSTRKSAWAAAGGMVVLVNSTSRFFAPAPYAFMLASLSGRRTPPDTSMPANTPCAREY